MPTKLAWLQAFDLKIIYAHTMQSSVGIKYCHHTESSDKTIKIKEKVEDFTVQEVVENEKCTISAIVNLEKFYEAEKLLSTQLDVELKKEDRKGLYDIAKYHPFKRMFTSEGKLYIENSSTDIFVFTLLKFDYSDLSAQKLLAKRLNVPLACIQTGGTKDKRAITLQEVSIKCSFETLFNYAFSLSKNPKMRFEGLGYCTELDDINIAAARVFGDYMKIEPMDLQEEIGIYNIRRGGSKRLGDLSGNYFTVRIRNFFNGPQVSTKFYNYFGPQRFGNNGNNHIVGEAILNEHYERAIELILKDETYSEANPSATKKFIQNMIENGNKPKFIVERLSRRALMIYLHAYQSYLFNMSINSIIAANEPDAGCDKTLKDGEFVDVVGNESLDEIYVPLKKMSHKLLKGGMRKMVEEISELEKSIDEEGTVFKFFLPKSCYATIALWELTGAIIENESKLNLQN